MSSGEVLSWKEFKEESLEFLKISKDLYDTWSWEVKNPDIDGQAYLKYNKRLTDSLTQELINIEYHIIYSISYQVPVLYFRANKSDGKLLSLEQVWNLFQQNADIKYSREDMLKILTQMDHPIYFQPFFCLHPCHTSEILKARPKSRNRIITFISVMGSYLHLNLDNSYGLRYKDD